MMTTPPFSITSMPVPKLPILSPPLGPLFQVESGPVTLTVPVDVPVNPIEPPAPLVTVPPFAIVSVPAPWPPTTRVPVFVHVEFGPVTVTEPCEPGALAIAPRTLVNVPQSWTISVPELPVDDPSCMLVPIFSVPRTSTVPLPPPVVPRIRLLATALALLTTCAVPPLSMIALSVAAGTVGGTGRAGAS